MGKAISVYALGLALGVVLFMPAMASIALAAGDANETQCGAETEASPGFRQYLPDCRAFELVTPPYKDGAVLLDEPGAVSTDGSHVIMGAGGAFAGTENFWLQPGRNSEAVTYEFARGATGWQPTALTPPASEYTYSAILAVSSSNFSETLWGAQHVPLRYHEDIYLRKGPGPAGFHRIGPGTPLGENGQQVIEPSEELDFAGASKNLTHTLFQIESSRSESGGNLWTGDTTEPGGPSLYEYVYSGAEDREPVLVGVSNGGPLRGSLHVNEDAKLISDCGTELGSSIRGSEYNAVSGGGEVVFFTALKCSDGPSENELYARIDGEVTVALSEPVLPGGTAGECEPSEPCHEAENNDAEKKEGVLEGASENGERVFFLSEQPLVDGASADGMKLYKERLNANTAKVEQVVDVSNEGAAGLDPEVQGVVRVSENGERVYFVAKGKLTGEDRIEGREPEVSAPEAGADNLYVYEPDPAHPGAYHTVFVATLLNSGEEAALAMEETAELQGIEEQAQIVLAFEESEIVRRFNQHEIEKEREMELIHDAKRRAGEFEAHALGSRGPFGTLFWDQRVWAQEDDRPAQATPDGGFLLFSSSARLTPQDSSIVPQLFEYNAVGESLARVSIGAEGLSSGNVDTFQEAPRIPQPSFTSGLPTAAQTGLAITADGSRVFFTSAARLALQAEKGATNVYEYREGHVYLISGGTDASLTSHAPTVTLVGVDSFGQNALFVTASPLVPQQGDTQPVLYDAREDGGFPAPTLEPGCFGEACRGSSAAAPLSPVPGSADQAGGGNVSPSTSAPAAPKKPGHSPRPRAMAKARPTCKRMRGRKRAMCLRRTLHRASAHDVHSTASTRKGR
jgi:hypothetical protein